MVIGLTGGSGSGKSAASRAAADLGFTVIDADKVGHSVILKGTLAYNDIIKHFGTDVLQPDGEINRRSLGEIVFSDREKLELLNSITHPRITAEITAQIGANTVIDGAVLHKTPVISLCDKVVFVCTPVEKRIKLILSRDNIPLQVAKSRIQSQPSDEEYTKMADTVIHNDGTEEELYNKARAFFSEVMD